MTNINFMNTILVVITTESDKKNACKLGNLLLEKKLVGCVTYNTIESSFWWEGEINESKEVQLIIKCRQENINKVCKNISEHHSYEVPEIICFPVSASNDYYKWLSSL